MKFPKYCTQKKNYIGLICLILGGLIWWKLIRFPRQVLGTPKDHFKVYVTTPIPDSVRNLKVAFDDLIFNSSVVYWFRFNIGLNDVERIIESHSLQEVSKAFSVLPAPSWWHIESLYKPKIYRYASFKLLIVLWWDASTTEAYYMFVTF